MTLLATQRTTAHTVPLLRHDRAPSRISEGESRAANRTWVANVELVSAADVAQFVPQLRVDDILGGTYCPTDGFVDPHSVMMGFMLKARNGARGYGLTRL
jgi:glycine/D-amino acid oxidase-like deaminating enzyme